MPRYKILLLDAYDSFSNNVVSLLTTLLDADVDVLPIDSPHLNPKSTGFHDELRKLLARYDALVCGPGPGSPVVAQDIGLMRHIWDLIESDLIPVLGICLGFQSLAASCGATIRRLSTGLHGMIRDIDHQEETGGTIFEGVPSFRATLYHSLCADIGQDQVSETDWVKFKWSCPDHLPDLLPIAWVEEPRDGFTERILMGMKHRTKPFWGLQYHPESVCSDATGHKVIRNWFDEAIEWNGRRGRKTEPTLTTFASESRKPSLLAQSLSHTEEYRRDLGEVLSWTNGPQQVSPGMTCHYTSKTIPLPSHVEVPDIVELLQSDRRDHIILDSASAHASRIGLDVRGRHSIIALDIEDAPKLEHHVGQSWAVVHACPSASPEHRGSKRFYFKDQQTVWNLLADFMESRKILDYDTESPFIGGYMGYISYELGLSCIDVRIPKSRDHQRPDLCFAWATKSIVLDHLEGTIRIQYLCPSISEGERWAEEVVGTLQGSRLWTDGLRLNDNKLGGLRNFTPPITPTRVLSVPDIKTPDASEYESKVRQCQDLIAAGESYELCLTDQTLITCSRSPSDTTGASSNSWAPSSATKTPTSWQLYRSLRTRQPAPFGSYICLGGATMISSSPERFLKYDADGLCSMRPMKGTVKKSDSVSILEQAEKILHIPKEEAENLMIVDLVRHDLHSVCGSGHVKVPQLLKVEEYASVFQMISVVEGQLPSPDKNINQRYTGLDALAASLPPGSMTGAPKKRSCEILQEIEGHQERSLYSGVVGYMDAAGRGDWSVTIRTLFKWDDETVQQDGGTATDVWHIGAGGAVTALSTPEGEREEMFTKLKGPLGVFKE